ncbi:hypothetical protein ACMFMG_003353 [Clarireedia jacksonii]
MNQLNLRVRIPRFAAMSNARKACWTCADRRVRCDGGVPVCQKCSRAKRECQGYGMRLSWPRDDDKKRAIMSDSQRVVMCIKPEINKFFINTNSRDVKLHGGISQHVEPLLGIELPRVLSTYPHLKASHMDLVHYFYNSAYLSLVTFGVSPLHLRDILIRIAMTEETTTAPAVLHALLAFSSLRLNGLDEQAVQLKILALQFLSTSAKKEPLSLAEAVQHVAASMLLSSFEILIPSESSVESLWYIWGAIEIVKITRLRDQSHRSDIGHLLDWLDYHDLLSRFLIHHRRYKSLTLAAPQLSHPGLRGLQYSSLARHRPLIFVLDTAYSEYYLPNLKPPVRDTQYIVVFMESQQSQ